MSSKPDFAGLREDYPTRAWNESAALADPHAQFDAWFADALAAGVTEPNAMVLSTVSAAGEPSSRTVLLKGHDGDGFRFFTNHTSRKARDLAENPRASLLFPWYPLRRQIIVAGRVRRLGEDESRAYFKSRPYGSQIGAWASHQSAVIGSRDVLERRFRELQERWPAEDDVPFPDFWGGYLLEPESIEFWQGSADRLHDRLRYLRSQHGWELVRLSP